MFTKDGSFMTTIIFLKKILDCFLWLLTSEFLGQAVFLFYGSLTWFKILINDYNWFIWLVYRLEYISKRDLIPKKKIKKCAFTLF